MLERVAKLLNQAENAGTQAEADTFMEAAQRLAATHSIDLARARHATIDKQRTVPIQRTIHIGEPNTRGLRTITDLCLNICEANDVRVTISHDATRVYGVGFAEDIDMVEAMFASLQVQQAKFLAEFKAAGEWRNEKVYVEGKFRYVDRDGKVTTALRAWDTEWVPGGYKPQTWLTARLNFQEAFASAIGRRLREAKRAIEAEQREADRDREMRPHVSEGELTEHFLQWFYDAHGLDLNEDDSTAQELTHEFVALRTDETDEDGWLAELLGEYVKAVAEQELHRDSTALVLASKQEALDEAYAPARARARGSYRGGTSGASSSSGRAAGRSAANRASLGGGTAIGGVRGSISA